jgi:uncharacterized SAM-binding protein YcdF (DUF218 family)
MTSRRRAAMGLASAIALIWVAGFAWFVGRADTPAPMLPPCDGIVVLTGAAGRIETALHLLQHGHADRLLVSGVAPGTGFEEMAHAAGVSATKLVGHVTLGHLATTTRGNAEEIAAWAQQGGMSCLIVVTSGYHMPRTLLELHRALPGAQLVPYPVTPDTAHGRGWRLLAQEYVKFLAAMAGLSRLEVDELPRQAGNLTGGA